MRLLEGTANKHTLVRIGPDPSGAGSRQMTVVPVATEQALRNQAWIESMEKDIYLEETLHIMKDLMAINHKS